MKIWSILNEMLQRYIWLQMYLYWVEHLITWIAFTFMHKCWTLRDRNRQSWSDSFQHRAHTHKLPFQYNKIICFNPFARAVYFIWFACNSSCYASTILYGTASFGWARFVLFHLHCVCVCVCVVLSAGDVRYSHLLLFHQRITLSSRSFCCQFFFVLLCSKIYYAPKH